MGRDRRTGAGRSARPAANQAEKQRITGGGGSLDQGQINTIARVNTGIRESIVSAGGSSARGSAVQARAFASQTYLAVNNATRGKLSTREVRTRAAQELLRVRAARNAQRRGAPSQTVAGRIKAQGQRVVQEQGSRLKAARALLEARATRRRLAQRTAERRGAEALSSTRPIRGGPRGEIRQVSERTIANSRLSAQNGAGPRETAQRVRNTRQSIADAVRLNNPGISTAERRSATAAALNMVRRERAAARASSRARRAATNTEARANRQARNAALNTARAQDRVRANSEARQARQDIIARADRLVGRARARLTSQPQAVTESMKAAQRVASERLANNAARRNAVGLLNARSTQQPGFSNREAIGNAIGTGSSRVQGVRNARGRAILAAQQSFPNLTAEGQRKAAAAALNTVRKDRQAVRREIVGRAAAELAPNLLGRKDLMNLAISTDKRAGIRQVRSSLLSEAKRAGAGFVPAVQRRAAAIALNTLRKERGQRRAQSRLANTQGQAQRLVETRIGREIQNDLAYKSQGSITMQGRVRAIVRAGQRFAENSGGIRASRRKGSQARAVAAEAMQLVRMERNAVSRSMRRRRTG